MISDQAILILVRYVLQLSYTMLKKGKVNNDSLISLSIVILHDLFRGIYLECFSSKNNFILQMFVQYLTNDSLRNTIMATSVD